MGEDLESATLDKNLVFDAPLYWSHALIISRLIPKPHAAPRLEPPLLLTLRPLINPHPSTGSG